MTQGHDQNVAFLCVSFNIVGCLGYEKVKTVFPDIPSDQYKRIAYAASFDDIEREKLKDALAKDTETESAIDSFFCNALVREIGSDPCIESRSKKVFRELSSFKAHRLHAQLEKAHVAGIDEWLKEIKNYYENDSQFLDFYIEGLYALALQKSGITVRMKPYRDGGPDLQILMGCLVLDVEITRFIKNSCLENDLEMSPDDQVVECLIEMPDKSNDVWYKIEDKMKQLKEDKNGIILLHSDNMGIDDFEFGKNARYIASLSEKLSAVIFVDSWTNAKYIPNPRARTGSGIDPPLTRNRRKHRATQL